MLLLDSWSPHCSNQLNQSIPENKEITFSIIPKKTTDIIQSLDVFGYGYGKILLAHLNNIILLDENINLHLNNEIIQFQSLKQNSDITRI